MTKFKVNKAKEKKNILSTIYSLSRPNLFSIRAIYLLNINFLKKTKFFVNDFYIKSGHSN